MKRAFLASTCHSLLALPCAFLAVTPHPNILFILTEDQGPHIGHTGTPGVQTPHMDSLTRS